MESTMSKDGTQGQWSPLDRRDHLRVCHVRAMASSGPPISGGSPVTQTLDLGRLTGFLEAAGELAPVLVASAEHPGLTLGGQRSSRELNVDWQRFRLQTAAGGIVDVRVMSTPWESLRDTISLLEDLHYETLTGEPTEWGGRAAEAVGAVSAVRPFHQLVFVPDSEPEPSWETIQRLIYRADLDAIEEHSSIGHPDEINRRPSQLAAVGSFGSVLWGIQDYVERSLILSAASTVAALATIHDVRLKALAQLQQLRAMESHGDGATSGGSGVDGSAEALTGAMRELSWLEANLTFSAEASAAISPLLQSLRVESFHRALYASADVMPQAQLVGQMLTRLRSVTEAELSEAAPQA